MSFNGVLVLGQLCGIRVGTETANHSLSSSVVGGDYQSSLDRNVGILDRADRRIHLSFPDSAGPDSNSRPGPAMLAAYPTIPRIIKSHPIIRNRGTLQKLDLRKDIRPVAYEASDKQFIKHSNGASSYHIQYLNEDEIGKQVLRSWI
jgi:hypothetical protein